jgi:hypothetical protein
MTLPVLAWIAREHLLSNQKLFPGSGRTALRKLGLIAGLPDEGEGQVFANMAATVTRGGNWPCGEGTAPKGNVLLLRTNLESLLDALDASQTTMTRALHRGLGRVGDYAIRGKYGHVYQDGTGFLICVDTNESARRWSAIKGRLAFCLLRQDGDDEGCLRLDRLPAPHEAEAIRGHWVSGSGGTCHWKPRRRRGRRQSAPEPL